MELLPMRISARLPHDRGYTLGNIFKRRLTGALELSNLKPQSSMEVICAHIA